MFPTASSVLGDILAIVSGIGSDNLLPFMKCNHTKNAQQISIEQTTNRYYISITANNNPGVIGTIGKICGNHNINLASVLQKGIDKENTARIIIITEESIEENINNAIDELKNNSSIVKINNLIRVME